MSRAQKILLSAIAGLAVVLIVCTIVVVKLVTDAQAQAAYRECLASYGVTPGSVTTEEQLDDAVDVAELCSQR